MKATCSGAPTGSSEEALEVIWELPIINQFNPMRKWMSCGKKFKMKPGSSEFNLGAQNEALAWSLSIKSMFWTLTLSSGSTSVNESNVFGCPALYLESILRRCDAPQVRILNLYWGGVKPINSLSWIYIEEVWCPSSPYPESILRRGEAPQLLILNLYW